MNLKLIISKSNKTVKLINVDAQNSAGSLERDLATWKCGIGHKNLRYTVWKNRRRNELNPYFYNRVNVHYTNELGRTVTKSYYCISEIIILEEMDLHKPFDSNIIN